MAYREQVREADRRADSNTLDRATDIVALYQDKRWVGQLPALQHKRNRGRPVEADSWPRFARWLRAGIVSEGGLEPSSLHRQRVSARRILRQNPSSAALSGGIAGHCRTVTAGQEK